MATVTEIAPDVFRLTAFNEIANFQFSSFLVRDDEPLLYHTNLCGFFDEIHEAATKVLDPATIRWIGFSHFESDECGSLNDWLALAPHVPPNLHEALTLGTFSSETIGDIGELDCVQACLAEVQCTASWYHQRHEAQLEDLHGLCLSQIETFNSDAASQKIAWAK